MSAIKWLFHNYGRKSNCQRFGKHPAAVRNSNHYKDEYIYGLVERYDYLIDWTERAKNEARFIINNLRERGIITVLDAATGTGFDSIQLILEGFNVTSLDGSYQMLLKARQNAKKHKIKLSIIHSDWRRMRKASINQYDAIICLGNSISHLFTKNEQLITLSAFYHSLKPGGILIVDHLNYERILKTGAFERHTLYFTGKDVKAALEYFDTGLFRFSYTFPFDWIYFLHFFPIMEAQFKDLLSTVGFKKITVYGDFNQEYSVNENEFYIYIAEKRT